MLLQTIVSFSLLVAALFGQLPDPLPGEFFITQELFSWTSTFDIESKEHKFGYIHRKFFSIPTEYEFYNVYDQLEAKAKAHWFTWGATFDVVDAEDKPLGMMREEIFTFYKTYSLISPEGEVLAIAEMNFWGTEFTLKEANTDLVLATLSRSFFRFKDDWMVTINHLDQFCQSKIDPRLLILVMAYQSDKEMQERRKNH